MQTLTVALDERSYPIYIGAELIRQPELLRSHIPGRQVMVISNTTVAPLYLAALQETLNSLELRQEAVILPDGEQHKTLTTLNQIFDALLEHRFDRGCTLIALGGGVIGDMAGFAAACYQRGVHFIQVPTTLLAQVDSSVGGKTAVNHPRGKNMIGAFYQPRCVLADTATLNTLPDRELSAGLAEIIKIALVRDRTFFDWLENTIEALLARQPEPLAEAIAWACRLKAELVALDERESGVRALLNLGHTFGHAIEAGLGYGEWLHGEAVAAGTVIAARLSEKLGQLKAAEVERISVLLARARLPITPPDTLTAADFIRLMAVDKKVQDGKLRFVLLNDLGEGLVADQVPQHMLQAVLRNDR